MVMTLTTRRATQSWCARPAREGNAGAVRALAESGKADVNRAAPSGALPLVQAIFSEDTACAEALLDADGINTNKGERNGQTSLMAAANMGNAVYLDHVANEVWQLLVHFDLLRVLLQAHSLCTGKEGIQ